MTESRTLQVYQEYAKDLLYMELSESFRLINILRTNIILIIFNKKMRLHNAKYSL